MAAGAAAPADDVTLPERVDDVARWVTGAGRVVATFDARTQDSGNVSYGVDVEGRRLFVKTAGALDDPAGGGHEERVGRLRDGAELARSVSHPQLPPLEGVVESPSGPALVYAWADGELLHAPRERRGDPAIAAERFRRLPLRQVLGAVDAPLDLHLTLSAAGWVAGDLYTGCLLYSFAREKLAVVDLDHYQRGPYPNTMGRMFGSLRLMAPEELALGATIDQRTTVLTLARLALALLGDEEMRRHAFRGGPALLAVIDVATEPDPAQRFTDVHAFVAAWRAAAPV